MHSINYQPSISSRKPGSQVGILVAVVPMVACWEVYRRKHSGKMLEVYGVLMEKQYSFDIVVKLVSSKVNIASEMETNTSYTA